jgi:soluble lytic murein transglycosylase-like protein
MSFDPRWRALLALAFSLGFASAGSRPASADVSDLVERVIRERSGAGEPALPPTREEVTRNWDAFLTSIVKRAGADAPPGTLRDELLAVLIGERHRLVELMAEVTIDGPEQVDELFESTWEQLAPILARVAEQLPPETASRYRSFLEAGDLMRAAERLGVARDLAASPESLRKLAEMLLDDEDDPLRFDEGVDPDLRAIFGFGPPLEVPAKSPLLTPVEPTSAAWRPGLSRLAEAFGAWLLPAAFASGSPADRSELVARLNTWIPGGRIEVRQYVPMVHDLLRITAGEATTSELDSASGRVFRNLVVATAWQESCWRQFVRREGGVVHPLLGPAGAVGLMQINSKVWRGIYDRDGLEGDIGYNGRAGAEILAHYLQDHALRAGEQHAPGGSDNLARATYAAYNGGPRHLARYRKAQTSPHLRVVDQEFWRKYQAVKAGDERQMFSCYPTTG